MIIAGSMIPVVAFDIAIALVVAGIPLAILFRVRAKKPCGILCAVGALLWVTVVYGSFVEPRLLVVKRHAVRLGPGDERIRIALVSDFHLGPYKGAAWAERVVREVNKTKPDVVVLAGDLVLDRSGLEQFGPFRSFAAPKGTYAVLGNWDYRIGAVDVRHRVEAEGVEVLTNESVPIPAGGREVRLIGLDDRRYGKPDWDAALRDVPEGALTIVASHNPDAAPEAEIRGMDAILAAHTHCGQIRLPFIGPPAGMPTTIGRQFDCGVFPFGPTTLVITPGVGESGPRARLFDPPEITVIDIGF